MATKAAVAATGGLASIAAPVAAAESEPQIPLLGDTVNVVLGLDTGFELASKVYKSVSDHIYD